jgi:hypothetical protein
LTTLVRPGLDAWRPRQGKLSCLAPNRIARGIMGPVEKKMFKRKRLAGQGRDGEGDND